MEKNKKRKKGTKKKLFLISGIIILVLLLIGGGILVFKHNIFKYHNKLTIEVGDNIPKVSDFLYKNDDTIKDIIWEDVPIEDNKIYKPGTYTGKFKYKKEEISVILIVEDTKPPIITGVKDIEMLAYENDPDFLQNILVADNSKEDIKASVEGEYDSEKSGEYSLSYVAVDSSENETKIGFKLIVKENENIKVSKSSKGYTVKNSYGITYIDNIIIANKTYGLPSDYVPNNLTTINGYIKVVDFVKDAFNELKADATSVGLNIYASSGYRSYGDQKYIYNNYVSRDGRNEADTYSARAGYSEHQTGLAIDLNTVDSSFDNTDESNWLKDNCYKYGFIIRYPNGKEGITGYMYEPWHIRYVGKDIASKIFNNGNWLTIEEYYGINSSYN